MPDIVVGSGPAGVSVAKALLARGRTVVMVDVGGTLEAGLEAQRANLAARAPDAWSQLDRDAYTAPQLAQGDGDIRRYGSDFLVRDATGLLKGAPPWLGLKPSFAQGGLSNAWGASVLPYRQQDMAGWPITSADLSAHYKAVAGFMPIAGASDALQEVFPEFDMSESRPVPRSTQAKALLARIEAERRTLREMHVVAGGARQAVATDCRLCGLCLHGCPYEYIFKASQVLRELRATDGFTYRGGLRAVAFEETGNIVRLTCRHSDGATEVVEGGRLFIAAGVLPTAHLVLNSFGKGGRLVLRDSQHFFLPLLHRWNTDADPSTEPRHTMTQVFIELMDPAVSPFTVHAQLYTFNEFYALDMKRRYGRLLPFGGPVFDAIGKRLIASQVFLHSDHSHRLALALAPGAESLNVSLIENPAMADVAARARAALGKAAARLGMLALGPASRFGGPGSSFHVGASMPMSASPKAFETDALGRIAGAQRVHVVDASILPAIPATTITFAVMANAHRIGTLA